MRCESVNCVGGPGQSLVEGPFECSNEPSVSTKGGEIRNQLFECQLANGNVCPRSCSPQVNEYGTCQIVRRGVFPVSKSQFCFNRPYRYLLYTLSIFTSIALRCSYILCLFTSSVCIDFVIPYVYEIFIQGTFNEAVLQMKLKSSCQRFVFCLLTSRWRTQREA